MTIPTSPLDRAVARAIERENADPQGLPPEILSGMETDIRANPEKYPLISALLAQKEQCRA